MYNNKIEKTITYNIIIYFIIFIITFSGIHNSFAAKPTVFANRYAEIVIDANSGNTLFSVNENAKRYPASLTKLMTLYLLFDSIKAGRVSLNTPIPVSKYAASMPPTKIGFSPGQTITAEEAAKAMITKSANDVAAAVGEYLGGTEKNFARMMTLQAYRLGMMNTHFANASGLPNLNNYATARDLATLSLSLRQHFPDLYYLFNTTSFIYRGRTINGHNHILKNMHGVDGLKTGYTQMSGFNLATSYKANNKSLVAVTMGWRSAALRDTRMASLLKKFIKNARISTNNRYNIYQTNHVIPVPHFKNSKGITIVNVIQNQNANPIRNSLYRSKITNTKYKHTIQVGTAKNKNSADKLYSSIFSKNKKLLAQYRKQIIKYNNIYRLRITHIPSKNIATNLCKTLKKQKFMCFVVN